MRSHTLNGSHCQRAKKNATRCTSSLGFEVKVINQFLVVPSSLGSRQGLLANTSRYRAKREQLE